MTALLLLVVTLSVSLLGGSPSESEEALWNRAVESVYRSRDWAAGKVVARTEIADGDGELLEVTEDVLTLTGWDGDKPVRKKESQHRVIKKSFLSVRITIERDYEEDSPLVAFRAGRVTLTRSGEESLAARECIVFGFRMQGQGKEGGQSGSVWIDRATGMPLKEETKPDKHSSGMSSMSYVTWYQSLPEGVSVPRERVVQGSFSRFLFKRRITWKAEYSDWARKPGNGNQ